MTYIPGSGSGGGKGQIATSSDTALNNPASGNVLAYKQSIAKWANAPRITVVKTTQAEFDALAVKRPDVMYVLIAGGTTTPPPSSTELIINPTFDIDITSWNAGANTTLAHETTGTQAGTGALRMTAVAAGEVKCWSERFAVDPTKSYNFTAYVKAGSTGRSTGLQIDWYSETSGTVAYISSNHHYTASTISWAQRQVLGVQPPANAVSASVALVVGNASAGEVHFADSITAKVAV